MQTYLPVSSFLRTGLSIIFLYVRIYVYIAVRIFCNSFSELPPVSSYRG